MDLNVFMQFLGFPEELVFLAHQVGFQPHFANIYTPWLPESWYYAFHLFAWMGPIVLLQWCIAPRVLWANRKALVWVPLLLGTYLILTDMVAVYFGVWYFDKNLILGFSPGGVPIEEWAFFYLTALLVTQSFILFLPNAYRRA